jgi:hypothetical protein
VLRWRINGGLRIAFGGSKDDVVTVGKDAVAVVWAFVVGVDDVMMEC